MIFRSERCSAEHATVVVAPVNMARAATADHIS